MTAEFVIYLILMVLTGAWTGYITNDVAIKMLFREYGIGKFKFGGVIIKKRRDLEHNLALLVEKEIINHNTLKSQFHKPELKAVISKTVVEFFNEGLYRNTDNLRLQDLPGFQESVKTIEAFLKYYLSEHLSPLFIDLSKQIELGDFISREQVHSASQAIAKELVKLIQDEKLIFTLLNELYDHYKSTSLEGLFGEQVLQILLSNLQEILNTIFEELPYKHDKDVSILISKLFRDIDIDQFVDTMEKAIGAKPISYFINEDTLTKLYQLLGNYLKDPESKEAIEVFCEGLLIALKKIDKPIIDLFTGDLRIEVEKFLETQLPGIIDRLIEIVQRNSHEIEELIESSIDQTIYDQQAIKRIILSAIRYFLIENFTQKYDIINKIVEMLRGIDIDDLSATIADQVVDILHQKSISSIIVELENNNILTARLIGSQVHRILNYLLERYLSEDIDHTEFLEKQLDQVIKVKLSTFINTTTVTALTKQLIYNADVNHFIKSKIINGLSSIVHLPISSFINKLKLTTYVEKISDGVNNQLEQQLEKIAQLIFVNLHQYIETHQLSSLINEKNFSIHNEDIIEVIMTSLRQLLEAYQDIEVHEILHKINSIDNLSENVVNAIMDFLDHGLSQVLEGNIARVVEENIRSLSNEEILEMMQDFMGSKLKPLTILGAILGGLVGIGVGFLAPVPTFNWFSKAYVINLLINIPVYALLGYFTNVVAIYFIFRPYKPIFGIKMLHGIIPRQIPVLARVMGNIVSQNLLSEDSIDRMIHTNDEKIKSAIKSSIKGNQYRVVKSYIADHNEPMVRESTRGTMQYLKDHSYDLGTTFSQAVLKLDLNKIKTEVFIEIVAKLMTERFNQAVEPVSQFILAKLKSSRTLDEIAQDLNINSVSVKVNSLIENEVERVIEIFSDSAFLAKLIRKFEHKFIALQIDSIGEVFPEKAKIGIENFLYQLISNYLYSSDKQRSLTNYVINEVTTILNNNDSIDEMFGGRFIELINFNMTTILERIEDAVNRWLILHIDDINDSVTQKVYNELTVIQQVGYKAINGDKLIRDTVYRIVQEKIPDFVARKIDHLQSEFTHFFDSLGKIKLKDANLELRKEELHIYLSSVFESKEIEIKTRRFINTVLEHFYAFKMAYLFDLLGIETVDDIIKGYGDMLTLANQTIYHNLTNRREHINFDIAIILNRFIIKELLNNRVRNITLGITSEQVNTFVQNAFTFLNVNDFLYDNCRKVVTLLFNHLKRVSIETIIDEHYLQQDLRKFIAKIALDQNIRSVIESHLKELFDFTIDRFDRIVDDDLKDHLLNDIIDSAYEVISHNLIDILHAVDFKEVTIREVDKMDAKEIKMLFDSFASSYFRKLEVYGFFGGIFAIELSTLITFIVYMTNYIRDQKKK